MATKVWEPLASGVYAAPANSAAALGYSLRNAAKSLLANAAGVVSGASAAGQIQLTLVNLTDPVSLVLDHVSIGVATGTPPAITGTLPSVTFMEVTFPTFAHGTTLVQNVAQSSDWINLTFGSGDTLIYVLDCNASASGSFGFSPSISNGDAYYNAATASWNTAAATVPPYTAQTGQTYNAVSIWSQAVSAPTVTLMGAICL